jgi:hypothetical protein
MRLAPMTTAQETEVDPRVHLPLLWSHFWVPHPDYGTCNLPRECPPPLISYSFAEQSPGLHKNWPLVEGDVRDSSLDYIKAASAPRNIVIHQASAGSQGSCS